MYYYDAVTRETSWARPTAANVITQQELETLAAANAVEKTDDGEPLEAASAGSVQRSHICSVFYVLLSKPLNTD